MERHGSLRLTSTLGLLAAAAVAVPAPAEAQAPAESARMLSFNMGVQLLHDAFTTTTIFQQYDEAGDLQTHYNVTSDAAWSAGVALPFAGHAVGIELSHLAKPSPIRIAASVPHPLIFSFPRELETTLDDFTRRETALHLQGQYWQRLSDRLLLRGFLGPTIWFASQDTLSNIATADQDDARLDTVRLEDYDVASLGGTTMGYHFGFDLTWFLDERVGLAGSIRHSHGTATIWVNRESRVTVRLGGPHITAGLRYIF